MSIPLPPPSLLSFVEFDVVVSRDGVPSHTQRVAVDPQPDAERAARDAVHYGQEPGLTYHVVEPIDEPGLELAVLSMLSLNPAFVALLDDRNPGLVDALLD